MLFGLVPADAGPSNKSKEVGDYTIYYNAFGSSMLQPAIAKQYGIQRSRYRAVLNVVVRKKQPEGGDAPVRAAVTGTATNLNEQMRQLEPREVDEGDAIYYLAEFPVTDQETLDFDLKVTPQGEEKPFRVRFRQQFFIP
jgi:hypothetical protein